MTIDQGRHQTLVEVLLARSGSHKSITLIDGQDKYQSISYSQMFEKARHRLSLFQASGLKSGDQLIIQCGDNALFLEGFWASLLGGIVAVPVAGGNSREHRHKLFRIAQMLDNAALYTDARNLERIQVFAQDQDLSAAFEKLQARCCPVEQSGGDVAEVVIAEPLPDDTAFIQFSSGSTSAPKGIVLTHRNLIVNTASIIDGCLLTPEDHQLSWMPLTHDMGLIGFHLTPVVCDASHSLIPTDVFVRRPGLWLSETQRMQATVLCSPNFGYQHLLKSFEAEKYQGLDLSTVRLIFNGAEPISVSLCEQFMQALAPFNLDADAMFPVYGLAEASLAVAFPPLDNRFQSLTVARSSLRPGSTVSILDNDSEGARFVSVGKAIINVGLSIRNENDDACAENVSGRICIRGENVTAGYYKQPELNAQVINADGWLDTGDLGFMHEAQLYITGRAKDIIFINGQNVYPHDLEEILVQRHLVERGKLAIASAAEQNQTTEKLLVFVLHRTDLSDLERLAVDITRVLGMEAGVRVDAVVAVPRIPKTTSGKVQRFQLVSDYQSGEFEVLHQQHEDTFNADASVDDADHPKTAQAVSTATQVAQEVDQPTVSCLLAICNSHVEGMQLAPEDNLFELGISSLTLAEIHASIEDAWPDQVDITDLFDYPTVAELAVFLDAKFDHTSC